MVLEVISEVLRRHGSISEASRIRQTEAKRGPREAQERPRGAKRGQEKTKRGPREAHDRAEKFQKEILVTFWPFRRGRRHTNFVHRRGESKHFTKLEKPRVRAKSWFFKFAK